MRTLALILPLASALAAALPPSGARFVIAHVLSLDSRTGVAELAASNHGLAVGDRSFALTEARQGLEIEVLSVDPTTLEVRFLGGTQRNVAEGDRLTLYCGEITSPTQTTTPDHLPLPSQESIPPGTSELELFLREQLLQMDLLRAELAAAALAETTSEAQPPPSGWNWRGQTRLGVELEHNVDYSPLGLSTSDPQRALDDLDKRIAQAAPIVEQSGSLQARQYLEEAIELRNQAATLLATDPELALLLMQLSAFNVDAALRAADAPVPPQSSRRKVDDQENFFVENALYGETRTDGGTRVNLHNRLRATDRYRRALLSLGLPSDPLSRVGWGLRPEIDGYLYEPGFSDDSLQYRLDGELFRHFLSDRRLRLSVGERAFFRREYHGNGDDGYRTLKGFLEARYRLADLQSTALRYTLTGQRYNRSINALFDYDGHELSWSWERFGLSTTAMLEAVLETRDYSKPDDEDDYREARLSSRLTWTPKSWLTLFEDGNLSRRVHRETGEDNSDYVQWDGRAGAELRLWPRTSLQLEAGLLAVRYDAESLGTVDKERGDFNEQRYAARLDLGPWRAWQLLLEAGYERREYRRGETGEFETWLSADFSPIADFDRVRYAATLRKNFSRNAQLMLSASHGDDAYRTYSQYDNQRDLIQLQLTLRY
ncbi:hypothetical protein HS125_10110 [bacterium]|nr:hypothetical protein [bacterium]